MAPFRNPFARRPGAAIIVADEDKQTDRLQPPRVQNTHPGFERVETVGSKTSSGLSIRSARSQRSIDTGDYKLSVVNDSGVYLPPSPTDEKGLWPRQYNATRISTDTKTSVGDIDHFGISRESFDSYRRSFDISARAPVAYDPPPRASLDSARLPRFPRSALDGHRRTFQAASPPTPEEFEDVGLEEKAPAVPPPSKRRGFFSKFSTAGGTSATELAAPEGPAGATAASTTTANMSRWLQRKRAASNSAQGSELKPLESPTGTTTTENGRQNGVQTSPEA